MFEKGITKEEVKSCIEKGMKVKQKEGMLAKLNYISVAYIKLKDKYIIKTVMLEWNVMNVMEK